MRAPVCSRSTIVLVFAILGAISLLLFAVHSQAPQALASPTISCDDHDVQVAINESVLLAVVFQDAPLKSNNMMLGTYDADVVVRGLRPILDRIGASDKSALWLVADVGANQGQTMDGFLTFLSPLHCIKRNARFPKLKDHFGAECANDNHRVQYISFEPMPENAKALREVAHSENWELVGWRLFEMAVGDTVGYTSFYGYAPGKDTGMKNEQASLSVEAARLGDSAGLVAINVTIDTLDRVLGGVGSAVVDRTVFPTSTRIFLLKIDAEGFDPLVLRGASSLLRGRRVKFIVFEYNFKWFVGGRSFTLHDQVQELFQMGYWCFFLVDKCPRPLFGIWWHSSYEIKTWSNVFCGQAGDTDLLSVLLGLTYSEWHERLLQFWYLEQRHTVVDGAQRA